MKVILLEKEKIKVKETVKINIKVGKVEVRAGKEVGVERERILEGGEKRKKGKGKGTGENVKKGTEGKGRDIGGYVAEVHLLGTGAGHIQTLL